MHMQALVSIHKNKEISKNKNVSFDLKVNHNNFEIYKVICDSVCGVRE